MLGVSGSVHHGVAGGFTVALVLNTDRAQVLCTAPVTDHMVPKNTAGDTSAQVQDCVLCTVNPRIHCAHEVSASVEKVPFLQNTRFSCPPLSPQPVHTRSVCP